MQLTEKKKVLITGAFGYLGGRLAEALSMQNGYEVILASSRKQRKKNDLRFERIIWRDPSKLDRICSGIDIVIHATGMNAEDCTENPEEAIIVNALNTTSLLQASIRQKVKRFIYFSTAHVYDNPLKGYFNENICPQSLHPYATSHRAAEDVIRYAQSMQQIEGIVIRLSNSFGAPVFADVNCWKLFVNDLCLQSIRSGLITIKSNPLQQRNFIAITEVVRAVIHLIGISSEKIGNCIFNLGSNWNPSLLEMAEKIKKEFENYDLMININCLQQESEIKTDSSLDFSIAKLIDSGYQPIPGNFISEELQKLISFILLNKKNIKA